MIIILFYTAELTLFKRMIIILFYTAELTLLKIKNIL